MGVSVVGWSYRCLGNESEPISRVAEGGLQNTLPRSTDPIADWIDLMETVDALCPNSRCGIRQSRRVYTGCEAKHRGLAAAAECRVWIGVSSKTARDRANVFCADEGCQILQPRADIACVV